MSTTSKTQDVSRTAAQTRTYLRNLARRRANRMVNADDANSYLNSIGIRESKLRMRQAVLATVFQSNDFKATGMTTPSTRPAAKGRNITQWTI